MERQTNMFYQILSIFTSFFLLNLMWLIVCLPIITIFPATSALFGTVRRWTKDGFDVGILRVFIQQFKENFKKSFIIGIFWLAAFVILYMDVYIVLQNEFIGRGIVIALVLLLVLLFAFTTVYVFFVLVNYELTIIHTLKNALFLAISHLNYTVIFIGMILIGLIITYYFTFFLLIFGSVLAFSMYNIFHSRIQLKLEQVN
ncbi:YesL family protein [Bacillus salinus]|uniref:YesL family protein n=1 Tax=Bacillus sp. HMF5848 TaxID=2495421 RepID=UPI00163B4023|nr:DUF624 domain-containing protein [Bacillus sp. HMF5848]